MITYIVVSNDETITLNIMGRTKTFTRDEAVTEDAYTKAYPQHFQRIGETKGYSNFLSVPTFIPDAINEFVKKEEARSENNKVEINQSKIKEVEIDEIAEAIEEYVESEYNIDIDSDDIKEIIENEFDENDVTIETEEN